MEYVQQSLTPGEEIVFVGQFHWMYTLHAALYIVWGILGCLLSIEIAILVERHLHIFPANGNWLAQARALHPAIRFEAFLLLVVGLLRFVRLMVIRASTEIAVTNHRIIYKRGLVGRYVGEISIDRIEGINILQSVPGRMWGYGRVLVRGMGVGEVTLPPIANPVAFRKAIEKAKTA